MSFQKKPKLPEAGSIENMWAMRNGNESTLLIVTQAPDSAVASWTFPDPEMAFRICCQIKQEGKLT